MRNHADKMTRSLQLLTAVGLPAAIHGQNRSAATLVNLSTVATFFSAVTATVLQYSYADTSSPLARESTRSYERLKLICVLDAVNTFWFASLIFSVSAAVYSLLGLTWKKAM